MPYKEGRPVYACHLRAPNLSSSFDSLTMSATHPPTNMQLEDGRARLREQEKQAGELQQRIEDAQRALEEVIAESTRAISAFEEDKRRVESEIKATREFLSPMRRLPVDVLRHIFLSNFEDAPCCAWTLAGVCSSWRRVVLNMPTVWSKVRYGQPKYPAPRS